MPAASSSNRADVVTMPVRPPGSEPPPDVEPRWTAIDPNLLTVEIGLLLDYISGVPGHSLASGSRGRLPSGCSTYEEALTRYFAIDERMRRREPATPADVQFLLELRDYLNGQAEPATGATIAFSTLVIRNTPDDTKAKADVARAYPEWIPLAQALRRTMLRLQVGSLIITVAIAVIAAYAYVGNRMLANLADIEAQLKSLNAEIGRYEEKEANVTEGGVLRYCDAIAQMTPDPSQPKVTVPRFRSPTQSHVCARQSDLLTKLDLAYEGFGTWIPKYDRNVVAALDVLRGYVLPVLMGLLGSMAYVLRRYLRNLGERLITPRDRREYLVRIVLGTVSGVAIGFFTSTGAQASDTANHLSPMVSLSAPALAFLAGYGVEVVFRMLDGLAEQIFAARK